MARHSDLRLFQEGSPDKRVSVTLNVLNEWFPAAAAVCSENANIFYYII